jgi:hypothetical protein
MNLRLIWLALCSSLGFPSLGMTQSPSRTDTGIVVDDVDRGWMLQKTDDSQTILNDRLLVRTYSLVSSARHSPSFESSRRADEPLSMTEHARMVEKRSQNREKIVDSNRVFSHDFGRYPQFRAETSRLVHILIRSVAQPEAIDELVQHSRDVDFESAYHFVINGCDPYEPNESWGEKAKCCLTNCFLTQAFAKISDSQRVSIDECLEVTEKLIRMVESQMVECSKLSELKNVRDSLLTWKREKNAVENRLKYFPTPHDVVLNFMMSRGNIIIGRATLFEDSHYDELKHMFSNKDRVEAGRSLWECTLPSRYVVANRAEGTKVLSVGDVLEICTPKDLVLPRAQSVQDKSR